MCDAKRKQLLARPIQICTLGDRDEVFSLRTRTLSDTCEVLIFCGALTAGLDSSLKNTRTLNSGPNSDSKA